jgi:adenylate kinase family enzyme/GNAT superfamily N-acetyltransferase
MPRRLHVFGASGSGTTTLAAAVAARHGHRHLDTDDFYWLPTNPPYREVRPREARLSLLRAALEAVPAWVLSGSLCGWGDPLIAEFELAVFLVVPTDVRVARLRAREVERYGPDAIAPGGSLRAAHVEFLDWAGRYDGGGLEMRSRALHDVWRSTLPCPVLGLEGDRPVSEHLARLEEFVARMLPVVVERLSELPAEGLGPLVAESERAGLRFVRRLAEEWAGGRNRFDRPGETCFGAWVDGRLVGVCGLNVDPYSAGPGVGRVRHLYVLSDLRGHGVGERLVRHVIAAARGRFDTLRLRTQNPPAARLYERLGFRRSDGADCTHLMELG